MGQHMLYTVMREVESGDGDCQEQGLGVAEKSD